MTLFKFKNTKQCKHRLVVKNHVGIVIMDDRCVLDVDHDGQHSTGRGQKWFTHSQAQKYVEDKLK